MKFLLDFVHVVHVWACIVHVSFPQTKTSGTGSLEFQKQEIKQLHNLLRVLKSQDFIMNTQPMFILLHRGKTQIV